MTLITFLLLTTGCAVRIVAVEGVELSATELTLLVGMDTHLVAVVSPPNAMGKDVLWSSSDDSIASVDSNGNVTAKAVGTVIITIATTNGGKQASCVVNVEPLRITALTLNHVSLILGGNETAQLTATVSPAEAISREILWTSSDEDVAIVSSQGLVMAISDGEAIITATIDDGIQGFCRVQALCCIKHITALPAKASADPIEQQRRHSLNRQSLDQL